VIGVGVLADAAAVLADVSAPTTRPKHSATNLELLR